LPVSTTKTQGKPGSAAAYNKKYRNISGKTFKPLPAGDESTEWKDSGKSLDMGVSGTAVGFEEPCELKDSVAEIRHLKTLEAYCFWGTLLGASSRTCGRVHLNFIDRYWVVLANFHES
jgi:hypothetical protein